MQNRIFITGAGGRINLCCLRAFAEIQGADGRFDNLMGINTHHAISVEGLAESIQHDPTHGRFPIWQGKEIVGRDIEPSDAVPRDALGSISFGNGTPIWVFNQGDPSKLPLRHTGVDVVLETSGRFLTREKAQGFLDAGAKKVIMGAPAKDDTPLIIYDINGDKDTGLDMVSLGSCTTNCAAPLYYAIRKAFGKPNTTLFATTHATTNSQSPLGGNASSVPNSIGSMNNIVPTTTGATKSMRALFGDPDIPESFLGSADRVPVTDGSVLNLTFIYYEPNKDITKESVLNALRHSGLPSLTLTVTDREKFYSAYCVGRPETCIVSSRLLEVVDNRIITVKALYDNEYAYAYHAVLAALNAPLPPE